MTVGRGEAHCVTDRTAERRRPTTDLRVLGRGCGDWPGKKLPGKDHDRSTGVLGKKRFLPECPEACGVCPAKARRRNDGGRSSNVGRGGGASAEAMIVSSLAELKELKERKIIGGLGCVRTAFSTSTGTRTMLGQRMCCGTGAPAAGRRARQRARVCWTVCKRVLWRHARQRVRSCPFNDYESIFQENGTPYKL